MSKKIRCSVRVRYEEEDAIWPNDPAYEERMRYAKKLYDELTESYIRTKCHSGPLERKNKRLREAS